MSKILNRIEELIDEGAWTYSNAVAIATAEQLERIADALEKQNAGNQMVMVNGRELGRLVHANLSSINVADGRKGSDEDFS